MTKNLKNILIKLQILFVSHLKDLRDPKKKCYKKAY